VDQGQKMEQYFPASYPYPLRSGHRVITSCSRIPTSHKEVNHKKLELKKDYYDFLIMAILTFSDSVSHFLCAGNYRMTLLQAITQTLSGKIGLKILQTMKHYTNYFHISNIYLS
jgi:hypothetical protein